MSYYKNLAELLYLIDKKDYLYFWQINSFVRQFRSDLEGTLSDSKEMIKTYLCKKRGIL